VYNVSGFSHPPKITDRHHTCLTEKLLRVAKMIKTKKMKKTNKQTKQKKKKKSKKQTYKQKMLTPSM
jgi:hypothetical protein